MCLFARVRPRIPTSFHIHPHFQLKLFMSTCLRAHTQHACIFFDNSVGTFRFIIQQFQHINQNVTRRCIFLDACELAIVLITIYVAKWQYFSISSVLSCALSLNVSFFLAVPSPPLRTSFLYIIISIYNKMNTKDKKSERESEQCHIIAKVFTILAFPFVVYIPVH